MSNTKLMRFALFLILGGAAAALAQESGTSGEQSGGGDAAQANNPLADIQVFDLENDTYHVPVGLGFGRVVPTEMVGFNFFVEPQFTILSKGAGQPEFQLLMAVNLQFR